MGNITIDGIEYYQPECHCEGYGHICYLRPVPNVVNIPIEKIIKATGSSSGNMVYANAEPRRAQTSPPKSNSGEVK